jgi:hypothetical protein
LATVGQVADASAFTTALDSTSAASTRPTSAVAKRISSGASRR